MYKENTLFLQNTMQGGIKGQIKNIFQQQPCCFHPEIETNVSPLRGGIYSLLLLFLTRVKIQCQTLLVRAGGSHCEPR